MRGQCLCGVVQFEIAGPQPRLYQCHCRLCRLQGGSSSNTATIVANHDFHWLAGEQQIARYARATGFRSHFCMQCGSPVPSPLRDTANHWVPAGLLDSDQPLEVVIHLFVGSRASWDNAPLAGRCYDSMPDMLQFIAELQGRAED